MSQISTVLLEPEHIKMIPEVLERISGTPHVVSLNATELDTAALISTGLRFRKMMKMHTDQINRDITSITIHTRGGSQGTVQRMVSASRSNGITIPIEIRIVKPQDK
jgi:hypothetical protein